MRINVKNLILYGLQLQAVKIRLLTGTFILYTFIDMKNCRGLVISKGYLKNHYQNQYERLNGLFGSDWYIYQDYTIYYLVVGECETSFISLKLDLPELIDGICFGILLSKHGK